MRKWSQKQNKRPKREPDGGPKKVASLWGVHAVHAAWMNPQRRIGAVYGTEQGLKELASLGTPPLARPRGIQTERRDLDRMLPPGAVHQGIAADAAPLDELFVQDIAVRAAASENAVIVMLDQVTDPHNVGAVMRSACAFGAAGIVMQSRHAPEITGVLAKAACGAVEHIPVAYETNLGRATAFLKEQGFTAVGLDERGATVLTPGLVRGKILLILGAEGKGLRQNLRESCDTLARLPTQGPIASLNVSNAAAVALYALAVR